MKILAIDTSTSVMGIALLDGNKVFAEMTTNLKKNHSVRLMTAMDQLFSEVNWSPNEIDLIGVAKGPGSYTGVRIGVTTAKTLSLALNIPLIGVSTLESMAYAANFYHGYISPIIDARRGQVYTGLYQTVDGKIINVEPDSILLLSEWLEKLKDEDSNHEVLFVGDDIYIHNKTIKDIYEKVKFTSPGFNLIRPSLIGWLAKEKYEGGQVDNIFDFAPSYLKLAEAEENLLKNNKG